MTSCKRDAGRERGGRKTVFGSCRVHAGDDHREDGERAVRGVGARGLAIARAMLQKADLTLLDEPTNHLDVNAVEWLAGHLRSLTDTTTLVVSHDYDFTDVATDIVHFEGQAATSFAGGSLKFRENGPTWCYP